MMALKLPIFSSSPVSSRDDRAQRVEQLALVEAVFAVAADVGDDGVEIVEHDILLRLLPLALGRCAFFTALPTALLIASRKGFRSGALPSDVIGM